MEKIESKTSSELEKDNSRREAQTKKPRFKRDEDFAEWRRLKKARLARRANRRKLLKAAGISRPNKNLTHDKKTGKPIPPELIASIPDWNAIVER